MKIPTNIIAIPTTLAADTFSLKRSIEPKVVNKKTMVANMGYARDRSLKDKTLNQITKDKPYKHKPPKINGLVAALRSSAINFAFSPLMPPIVKTPFFSRKLPVTLQVTLNTRRCQKVIF